MSPKNQAAGDRPGSMSKLAPELVALYDEYSSYLASGKRGAFKAANPLVQIIEDRVVIDAVASGDTSVLKSDLLSLGMRKAVSFGRMVSGQLPIARIPTMAALPSLKFARAASVSTGNEPERLPPDTPRR